MLYGVVLRIWQVAWRVGGAEYPSNCALLWQIWPWHISAMLGNHLQEGDRQRIAVRGPDGQTEHPHVPVCGEHDQSAGREAGLDCPHPEALCNRVSSADSPLPFATSFPSSCTPIHSWLWALPHPLYPSLFSLPYTLNLDFFLFSFSTWLPLPVITLCLMSTAQTYSTSTFKWRNMKVQRSSGSGVRPRRAVPPSWCVPVCTIPRPQHQQRRPREQRNLPSTDTATSTSARASWRPPTLCMMWTRPCSWFSAGRAGLRSRATL